jgi:hypothetical protein
MPACEAGRVDAEGDTDVTGAWSSEHSGLYHGAFEDETLVFGSDGSGRHELSRPGYAEVSYFTWYAVASGEIAVSWGDSREIMDGTTTDQPPRDAPVVVAYRITTENTPLAGRRLILRITPAVDFVNAFGLLSRDPDAHPGRSSR